MKWKEVFPRNYMNASDFDQRGLHYTVAAMAIEDVAGKGRQEDMKAVMYVHGEDRGIVVNKSNGIELESKFGEHIEDCVGKEVKVFQGRVMFNGKLVPGVMISPVVGKSDENIGEVPAEQKPRFGR